MNLVLRIGCLFLVCVSHMAYAYDADISVGDLYSNRLIFSNEGRPLVPVKMMKNRKKVVVSSEKGLTVRVDGSELLEIPGGEKLTIKRVRGKKAKTKSAWILETLEGEKRLDRKAAQKKWAARGVKVEMYSVGGVYGMRGTVFDNRAVHMISKKKPSEDFYEKYGVRPNRIRWIEKAPTIKMSLASDSLSKKVTGSFIEVKDASGGFLTVKKVEHSKGYASHGYADRNLRQTVIMSPDRKGKIAVINLVFEDVLVAGILPSEMFPSAPMEALKAQAVTARGELFAKIGRRHFDDPSLICSEQHCQVYKGLTAETKRTTQAASDTRGQLAFLDGKLVDSVYSASCGGHTEPGHIVWDRAPSAALKGRIDSPLADPLSRPWLQSALKRHPPAHASNQMLQNFGALAHMHIPLDLREERAVREFLELPRDVSFCGMSSFGAKKDIYRWERRFTQAELTKKFEDLGVGEIQRLSIPERGPGGRLRTFLVEGSAGKSVIHRELPVRRRLGNLRSGLFVIDDKRAEDGRLEEVIIKGGGFGHGSGMCQLGAIGMAESGYDYREILRHYYSGATVKQVF